MPPTKALAPLNAFDLPNIELSHKKEAVCKGVDSGNKMAGFNHHLYNLGQIT